jgi:UDP-N-acetyl-2-amino-2-deoxyglucuronate dehydrogenase
MSNLSVGIVGCGMIAEKFIAAISQVPNLKLAALFGTRPDRMRQLAGGGEIQQVVLNNYSSLPASPLQDLNLIIVLTQSGTRFGPVAAAAAKGVSSLVTKPMCLRTETGEKMIQVCKANGVRLGVAQPQSYNSDVLWLRDQLRAGRFGKILDVSVVGHLHRGDDYYLTNGQPNWHCFSSSDNGAAGNQGQHEVQILMDFFGPAQYVSGGYARATRSYLQVPDYVGGMLHFANDIIARVHFDTCSGVRRAKPTEIEIIGATGFARLANNRLVEYHFDHPEDSDPTLTTSMEPSHAADPKSVSIQEFVAPVRSFAESLRTLNRPFEVEFEGGLHSVRAIEGLVFSAMCKSGLVQLPVPTSVGFDLNRCQIKDVKKPAPCGS